MLKITETFSSTCVLEDYILPNTWNIEIIAHPNGQKDKEFYTKAVERIQFYIFDVLENSIFVSGKNLTSVAKIPYKASVHVFPTDPWDHLVAMSLYVKMTAMCEDVLFIESVTVNSLQSRTVSHCFGDADGGSSILHDLFKDDPDSADFIKYWYKPYPQLMLLHEGLKLIDQKWEDKEIDITYEKNYTDNKGTVIDLKSYKKKPPGNNDGDNA